MSAGRPLTLTPEIQAQIVKKVRDGNFRETAASAVGIDARTLRTWMKRGWHGEEPFASLCAAMDKAEAESEAEDIGRIRRAGKEDWRAIAWRRERMSSRWQLRLRVEVNKELDAFLDALRAELDPATYERVLAIASRGTGGAAAIAAPSGDADPTE